MADLSKLTAEELEFRDDAALAALQGLISGRGVDSLQSEAWADMAYAIADAMLAARSKEAG